VEEPDFYVGLEGWSFLSRVRDAVKMLKYLVVNADGRWEPRHCGHFQRPEVALLGVSGRLVG